MAKRDEEIFLTSSSDPIYPDGHDPAHLVLRAIRDEAHRFVLSRQRKRRRKKTLETELLALPGIGPARARNLLKHFGSVRAVQHAGEDELTELLGPRLGSMVFQRLHE